MGRKPVSLPTIFDGSGIRDAVVASGMPGHTVWHAPCPKCGGKDRVFVLEQSKSGNPFAFCRQRCGYKWSPGRKAEGPLSDEDRAAIAAERRRRTAEHDAEQAAKKASLAFDKPWTKYLGGGSDYWEAIGISPVWQGYWRLGYCPERSYSHRGETHTSPAHTIPKFGRDGTCKNIDFRLVEPVAGAGRYRPMAGLDAAAFINYPGAPLTDEVFVLEGSKKAMVVSLFHHNSLLQQHGKNFQNTFIGIPSQNSWAGADQLLRDCRRVWYLPDPDAITSGWADSFALSVGPNCRIVQLPEKPDDMITDYGVTWKDWRHAFQYAREGRFTEE